jgi:Spy/CpxP family protein refolding chaperone
MKKTYGQSINEGGHMKNLIAASAAAMLFAFAASSPAWAGSPHGMMDGAGDNKSCEDEDKGHGPGAWMSGHMQGVPEYGRMYLSAIEGLGLSADQKKGVQEIFSNYRKKTIRLEADLKVAEVELEEFLGAAQVNLDAVKAKISDMAAKKAELRFFRIKSFEDLKKILNAEQLGKLKGMSTLRGGHMGPHRMDRMMDDE